MYKLSVKNTNGNILEITNNPLYVITSITGLSPAAAIINTAANGANDGTIFNSSRVNQRNIVITIRLIRDVEAARIALYSYFKTKQSCRLYYSNGSRDVYIDGYVESMQCDFFTQSEFMQISVICPNPFFRDVYESVSEMSLITPQFEFPFSIPAEGISFSTKNDVATADVYNGGDIVSGMNIELYANGGVTNPSVINANTLERFSLNYTMQAGDQIVIDTITGEKSVRLIRYGRSTNIINALGQNPNWLQLAIGKNTFTYSANDGAENLSVKIKHTNLYEGV